MTADDHFKHRLARRTRRADFVRSDDVETDDFCTHAHTHTTLTSMGPEGLFPLFASTLAPGDERCGELGSRVNSLLSRVLKA